MSVSLSLKHYSRPSFDTAPHRYGKFLLETHFHGYFCNRSGWGVGG